MLLAGKRFRQYLAALLLVALACGLFLVLPARAEEEDSVKETIVDHIIRFIKAKNVRVQEDVLKRMAHTVYQESKLYEMDYRLVLAVIKVESNFMNEAVSKRGARGLMQIKPSLAKYIAKDARVSCGGHDCLKEPESNIKLGVYHLSQLMQDFKDTAAALHAYNTGPAKVKGSLFHDNGEPKNRFAKRVLGEYRKNIEVLPDDDE